MQESTQETSLASAEHARGFNYNKLQAVICIVSSAAVSVALIVWAVKAFL
jgi:hypothetical protein